MSDGRTDDTTYRFFSIEPCQELFHFLFYAVWRRSNIVNLLTSKHTADNMFLVCSVLTNLYLDSFAIAGWKEGCLPSAKFLFA